MGLFPTCFKIGVVLLFYKEVKENENHMAYRPISLLLTLGKQLEKLMTQRLNYHLSTTRQRSSRQFGFREGRSIYHVLDELMQQVENCRGRKNHTAIISVDIQEAFDNLPHKLLKSST
ncbi:hypothetical protein AVEN_57493-1 [Araneus ventricosus]|uniref:Reverse transcriptase domain-containing protein n=1 Tax=Araneus ventricosus TaxID=182803 RepID=A0A4Y2CWZ3_ARAVE|nr:hypothetical protein AVEN_57493-1 [Araneus ventricosus]